MLALPSYRNVFGVHQYREVACDRKMTRTKSGLGYTVIRLGTALVSLYIAVERGCIAALSSSSNTAKWSATARRRRRQLYVPWYPR
jgi:hypothetical protein